MLHLDWETRADEKPLAEMLERRRRTGDRIVVYQRVFSVVVFTRLSNHYCLVSPYESRGLRGFLFFLPTFVTGWWSPWGLLYTCYALAHNLLGGIDVTDALGDPAKLKEVQQDRVFGRKRFLLCIGLALALVVSLFVLVLWAISR